MRKLFLSLMIFFLCFENNMKGQVSNYVFSTSTGVSLNSITGSTQLLGSNIDDIASSVTSIGFTFNFGCTNYTQFSVSSNGLMGLGSSVVNSSLTNNLTSSSTYPIIAPGWDDMHTGSNGQVHYRLTGTSPNRVLTVEWRYRNYSESGNYTKTVQVILYETSNVIDIVYGAGTNFASASVGIASSGSSFMSVTTSPVSSSTVAANNANTTFPASGTRYRFTPGSGPAVPGCATLNSPANGATNQTKCNPTISWTAPPVSGCNVATEYYVYFGTTTNPPLLDITTSTSYVLGTLNSSTQYYWRIVPHNSMGFATGCTIEFNFTTNSTVCSPSLGGAGVSNLTSWLKADNASSITGNPVSAWASSGGSSGISLTQGTAARRPTLTNGATNYTYFSYLPRVSFNASSSTNLFNNSLPSDLVGATGSIFYIGDRAPSVVITALSYKYGNNKYQFKPNFRVQTSNNGSTGYTYDFGLSSEYSGLAASELTCLGAGSNQQLLFNSELDNTCSNCNNSTYNPSINDGYSLGANSGGSEYSSNSIAEVLTYNTFLTTAQINKIETYLSIKYGITRGGNTGTSSTYNYVASDGSVIWDKTANVGYNNDIAGIGRDDISELNKKQSISVNNFEPVTVGLTSIATENSANTATFGNDKAFLVWGNNGLPCTSNYLSTTTNLPSGIDARLERIWKVQATNFGGIGGSNTYKTAASPAVTIGFETSILLAYTPISNLRVLVDDDGVNWSNATVYSGAALNTGRVEFSGIIFSGTQKYFTLATINYNITPLPVSLLSFNAVCENTTTTLKWETATETNSDYFEIQKSTDGVNFTSIGAVKGSGNSSQIKHYTFADPNGSTLNAYYRLKQVDFNKQARYYNIIQATNNCATFTEENTYSFYPNPSNGSQVYLKYNIAKDETTVVNFYDLLGKLISSQSVNLRSSNNQASISINDLAPAIYFIRVESTQLKTKVFKFIKE